MGSFEEFLARDDEHERALARIRATTGTNPDQFANTLNLSRQTGLPIPTVMGRTPEAQAIANGNKASELLNLFPSLAKHTEDPNFLRVAHDDLATLGPIAESPLFKKTPVPELRKGYGFAQASADYMAAERRRTQQTNAYLDSLAESAQALRDAKQGARGPVENSLRAFASSAPLINESVWGALQSVSDTVSSITSPLVGSLLPEDPAARASEFFAAQRHAQQALKNELMTQSDDPIVAGYYSGLQSLGQNLVTLPLAVVTGNPSMALAPMTGTVYGQSYGDASDAGRGVLTSINFAAVQAMVEYFTEKNPVNVLLKDLFAGASLLKVLANQAMREIPGEQVATLLQDLNEWAVLHPEKTLKDYADARPDAFTQTLVATLVGVGGQVTVLKGIGSIANRGQIKADKADQGAELLGKLGEASAASKTLARDPQSFEQFIALAAEDGPVRDVYIDAGTLMQSGLGGELIKASPSAAAQFDHAIASGGQIAIPVEEYAARVAPTELGQSLIDHVRTDPDGFTRAEAQEYMQTQGEALQRDIEKLLTDKQVDEVFTTSRNAVKQTLLESLNTTNRFTPAVNEANATLISSYAAVRAADLGITPEAFFQRHMLKVVAENVGNPQSSHLQSDYEVQPDTPNNLPIDGAALRDLRRAAAGLEAPEKGITFRVDEEGRAVVTGPARVRVPARFQKFANDNGLTLAVRRGPSSGLDGGRGLDQVTTPVGDNFGTAMPLEHRESGALYFGEIGNLPGDGPAYLDRTGKTLFQPLTTMVPTVKGTVPDHDLVQVPGYTEASAPGGEEALDKNTALFNKHTQTVAKEEKRGYDSINAEGATPHERAESIITQMVRNLHSIFDSLSEDIRQRSRLWYDGANRISLAFAKRYGLTPMQAAAQLAVTSPQTDWRMNVSYVERINDILAHRQDYRWDADMEKWATDWMTNSEESRQTEAARKAAAVKEASKELARVQKAVPKAQVTLDKVSAQTEVKLAAHDAKLLDLKSALRDAKVALRLAEKGGAARETKAAASAVAKAEKAVGVEDSKRNDTVADLRKAKADVRKAQTVVRQAEKALIEKQESAAVIDPNVAVQDRVRGKKLNELTDDFARAWFVRAYDEAHNPRSFRDVTPEGGFLGNVKLDDGVKDDSLAWKSFNPIAKAISIYRDGSVDNVHHMLGKEHKVRNFYNNIYAPDSEHPFVTSDTHQVAANLFLPLGAYALEVEQNFGGTGTKSLGTKGLNGTYWLYAEAVKRAAEARGVRPREMQSISWEAIRSLFSPSFKANQDNVNQVRDIWVKYHAGEQTYDDTIRQIVDLAGGFKDPAWVGVRPDSADAPEAGASSYESGVAFPELRDKRAGSEPGTGNASDAGRYVPGGLNTGGVLYQGEVADLLVQHNLTADNLLHAVKMGGIAVPSLAVAQKDNPLHGFGEITLLGSKDMVDPKGYAKAQVFGADIYSPRYPKVNYKTTDKQARTLVAEFKQGEQETGSRIDLDEFESSGRSALINSPAVMWQFLTEKNITPDIVMQPAFDANERRRLVNAGFEKFFGMQDHQDLMWNPEFQALVVADLSQQYKKAGLESLIPDLEKHPKNASVKYAYQMKKVNAPATVDDYQTRDALRAQIRGNLTQEFDDYVDGKFAAIGATERIFQGFTDSGNRRYTPHTLDNVVKILKKELRGGEGFNYGVGTIRSKYTPQFKSIEQIRAAKGRLIDGKAFDAVKKEIGEEFDSLTSSLSSYHPNGREFSFTDSTSQMMYDAATMGLPRALRENGFENVPSDVQQNVADFLGKLKTLPTEYFEAKILREVDLAEFSGAVVPEGTSQKVIDALRARGVVDIKTYTKGNEADRTAKIGEFAHLFFQNKQASRGSFNPATGVMALLKGADLSTFLHESGHYFFETDITVAAQLVVKARTEALTAGEQKIVDDVSRLMTWHGIQGDIGAQIDQWHNMPFEEKRAYHERTAESFEHYLFSGESPSIELQPYFQRFRAWLTSVYKSVRDFLAGHPEAGTLNPEVRGVFDRMLASNEEIALAEQARSMFPLFASPEQAGMTPEAFAAYHGMGVAATAEAIQELQARGLRDLQWLKNAHGREVKRLQKESRGKRAEVQMSVRTEVMSQPVYRAWAFLTGKLGPDDMTATQLAQAQYRAELSAWNAARKTAAAQAEKDAEKTLWDSSPAGQTKYRKAHTQEKARAKFKRDHAEDLAAMAAETIEAWGKANPKPKDPTARPKTDPNSVDEARDSLFTAIAKLGGIQRDQIKSEWGYTDKIDNPVFGKPVARKEGGLTIDGMAESLSQYGYLTLDENGKWDLHDFEEKFGEELRGNAQFSSYFEPEFENSGGIINPAGLTAARLEESSIPNDLRAQLDGKKMTAKEGLQPDIVADLIGGFTSGDEMLRSLADAEDPRTVIEGMTDQRMLEQYGDLSSQDAIERAADKAIHNDARARMVATELSALDRALQVKQPAVGPNGKPRSFNVLPAAAKSFAASMISRLKIRNVRPSQYSSAEARAAKGADKAHRAGDIAQAAAEKRNQMVNIYAARAAHEALAEVDKALRYFKRLDSAAGRKAIDADYSDQIDALLERFDLRSGQSLKSIDKRIALAKWLEAQRDAGLDPEIPPELENEAFRKSYKEMSVEEFRGLVDTVKQIEHLGRLKRKLLTSRDQREYEAIRDEIVDSINAHAGDRQANTRTPTTRIGEMALGMRQFWAAHVKVSSWARIMDGGKDGGPVWEFLVRNANERGDQEVSMRAAATQRLTAILAPVFNLGKMGGKGTFFPSINTSFNREGRIAVALNWGNEGNRQRLLGGEGWTPEQILPVLQSLSVTEWSAVQAIWDHAEGYRPLIAAKERRVYGKEPNWVEHSPFSLTLADGTTIEMRGGYYPIRPDPRASQRAEEYASAEDAKRQMQGAYTSATTRRSFTKSRVEEVKGRPLLYSLAGMYSGVNDVIHDLTWHEWLIDANRLLRSNSIDAAIRTHYGPEVKHQFKTWTQDIADGGRSVAFAGEQAISRLRQGVSAAGLGFNVMSAFMQPLGITQSIVRVGAPWIGRGIARYLSSPLGLAKEVNAKSTFMANRGRTRFRELNELRNQVQDESATRAAINNGRFYLMLRFQQMVDFPTWQGAYEKALSEGNDEDRSISLADQAVIDAQGSGSEKDLSGIERERHVKLFTVFYSFMNTALNAGVVKTMAANTPAKKARLAADYALLYVVPAVLGYALKNAVQPGGDDDEWDWEKLLGKLAAAQLDYLMGLMVVVREFAEAGKSLIGAEGFGHDYSGPAGLRLVADAGKLAKQTMQGEFDDAFRKASINVIGDLFGLPAAQANRTITGAEALSEGTTNNPAALVFGYR